MLTMVMDSSKKAKNGSTMNSKCKNLDKQEIGDILIKRNYKLSAFSTIWFL